MLFNSYAYLFVFFPIVISIAYSLIALDCSEKKLKFWYIVASLFFYSYWDVSDLLPFTLSLAFNLIMARYVSRKPFYILGVVFNVCLLGYFKYHDFLLDEIFALTGAMPWEKAHHTLPLAISFLTFQQIGFLGYVRKNPQLKMIGLTNYTFCIVYFAHLIAGPIVQIQDLRSQLEVGIKKLWSFEKIWIGIIYIVVGLSKKILIADSLAPLANHVFDSVPNPNAWEAAAGSLAYTFQLYFDFSGYCDIATGSSWIIGLELPSNFLSPYKATSIRDFWRRWHVTLGNFSREHIYIPLGGNKKGMAVQLLALFATFFIGGIWHGAGRTFIIWGSLHGVYTCAQTLYEKSPLPRINVLLSGIVTFLAVHCAWIFFRASSIQDAKKFFHAFDSWELTLPKGLWGRLPSSIKSISQGTDFLPQIKQQLPDLMPVLLLAMLLTWLAPNSHEIAKKLKPNILSFIALLFFAFWSVMEIGNQNVFLYFKF